MTRVNEYPPKVKQIVAEAGLGDVVGRYRMSLMIELGSLIGLAAFGAFGVIVGDELGRAMGAGALSLASIIAAVTWLKARKFLYLCTDGLLTVRGTVVRIRLTWDDVAHVRRWTTRMYDPEHATYDDLGRCTLDLVDGRRFRLHRGPYVKVEEIATFVEKRVAERNYARRTDDLALTGAAHFGPIVVTPSGVRAGTRFAAWSDITRIARGRVRLRIWTGGRRATISQPIRTIPDVTVLMAMIADRAA